MAPGLHDEPAGLGDGHEVAGGLGMGDGNRPPRPDLPAEEGQHRARGAHHVAEAHGHELGGFAVHGASQQLGHPLAGPHNVGGTYRLVSGKPPRNAPLGAPPPSP